jgi:hypothetical protein
MVDSAGCGQALRWVWAGITAMWAGVRVMWGSRRLPHGLRRQGLAGFAWCHCCSIRVTFVRSGSQ